MDSQIKGSTAARSQRGMLAVWAPVIVWIVILFCLSTSPFAASQTAKWIEPIYRWFFPAASAASIALMHDLTRKLAHFANYGILFWLMIRGPMAGRPYAALGLCAFYAMLDEGHQIFVPGRTPSVYDVVLDSSGALFSRFLHAAIVEAV